MKPIRNRILLAAIGTLVQLGCFGNPGTEGDELGNIDPSTECVPLADPVTGLSDSKIGQIETGRFEPIFPLQELYLVFGPQGGHHIDISMQFYTSDEGRWRHTVRLIDTTNEEEVGHGEAVFDACVTGWSQTDYIRIHVMPTGWVDCRIEVSSEPIEGQSNERLRDTVDVRIRSPQT